MKIACWLPLLLKISKSAVVQVVPWYCQAPSHCLSSLNIISITWPQWVEIITISDIFTTLKEIRALGSANKMDVEDRNEFYSTDAVDNDAVL